MRESDKQCVLCAFVHSQYYGLIVIVQALRQLLIAKSFYETLFFFPYLLLFIDLLYNIALYL